MQQHVPKTCCSRLYWNCVKLKALGGINLLTIISLPSQHLFISLSLLCVSQQHLKVFFHSFKHFIFLFLLKMEFLLLVYFATGVCIWRSTLSNPLSEFSYILILGFQVIVRDFPGVQSSVNNNMYTSLFYNLISFSYLILSADIFRITVIT